MELNFATLLTVVHMLEVCLDLSRGAEIRALFCGDRLCAFFALEREVHDSA